MHLPSGVDSRSPPVHQHLHLKENSDDIRDIAIQLNVDKVLEGSVRKPATGFVITAQLINAADGYHIWSENYDRNLTDIFEVQDEISAITR